jgi:membrane-anchored protein YejM (alkaline phosphatase superfamily)
VAGRLLAALERAELLDDTLVVLTGDHGEEFQECGYWGHTSNFTPEQLHVPLVIKGPGVVPGVERAPTSHVDLPATVLEMLGADPALRSGWTLGRDLLAPGADPERRRVAAGWSELGVWTPNGILRIPLTPDAPYASDVLDACWNSLGDPLPALLLENPTLETLVEECTRFLAQPPLSAASAGARARPRRR